MKLKHIHGEGCIITEDYEYGINGSNFGKGNNFFVPIVPFGAGIGGGVVADNKSIFGDNFGQSRGVRLILCRKWRIPTT